MKQNKMVVRKKALIKVLMLVIACLVIGLIFMINNIEILRISSISGILKETSGASYFEHVDSEEITNSVIINNLMAEIKLFSSESNDENGISLASEDEGIVTASEKDDDSGIATISEDDDMESTYTKTQDLTDADADDDYQKNYQKSSEDDGSYIKKSAEWTDKENGEALITIKASAQTKEETTALYVATMCYAHGLTEDILVNNILVLIEYYDYVDFIAINNTYESGIVDTKTFTSANTEDEIRKYISTTKAAGTGYPHYINSIPAAIERYLFGGLGDEYIDEDNMVKEPIAIYVSCDSFYLCNTAEEQMWGNEYATDAYFEFMNEKYAGRYFSMSQTSQQSTNPQITIRYASTSTYDSDVMNIVIGILNIENYGEADSVLSEESLEKWASYTSESLNLPYADKKYAAQYSYDKDFSEAGVKMVTGCTISDEILTYYDIVSVEVSGESDTITYSIDGQTVTVEDDSYAYGTEITIKIYVKLNTDVIAVYDGFTDTNVGSASFTYGKLEMDVESPQLVITTSNYKVNYLDKETNETIAESKTVENVAVNTNIHSADEIISIDGYNYDSASTDVLTIVENESKNVINIYYTKRDDLTYTVNYYDKDTGKLLETKDVENVKFKTIIYSKDEVKDFDSYVYDSADVESIIIGTGKNVINLYYKNSVDVTITKTWIDNNNAYKTRQNIVVTLYADGEITDKQLTLSKDNKWIATFEDLYKYDDDGDTIKYTITESEIDGYTSEITSTSSGYEITNTIEQQPVVIIGQKIWITPEDLSTLEATIELYRDGEKIAEKTLTGNTGYLFDNLDKYDLTDGHAYVYEVKEVAVDGYTTKINGYDITNTIEQEYVDVSGTKTWNDSENQYLTRPSSLKVNLLRDGEIIDTIEINEEDNWEYSFEDLEKYDLSDGHAYEYTISEETVENYQVEIDGYDITNTYIGTDAEIESKITKVASSTEATTEDGNLVITTENQPITYTISYYVNITNYAGKATVTITDYLPYEIEADTADLDDGEYSAETKTITWTEEIEVTTEGYENTFEKQIIIVYVDQDVNEDIENTAVGNVVTYYPESYPETPDEPRITEETKTTEIVEQEYKTSVDVRKVWDDNDDLKEHRPDSVTVSLFADGETAYDYDGLEITSILLDDDNEWQYVFENLPKYDEDGNEIVYTIVESETEEDDLEYYETAEITYGDEYVEVKNTYKTKDTDLDSDLTKTATEEMTSSSDEITYTITYNATISEYIGEATLTVVDTLSYGIDEENSDLADGTYNSNTHTITWEIDLGHINTDEDGAYEVSFQKTITIVYGEDFDASIDILTNNVTAKLNLLEDDESDETEDEAETEVDIPAKIIVQYVDTDTGEVIEEYETDGTPGDEYEVTKEDIDGYSYVKDTNNTSGEMTEETITVIFYYQKNAAQVHVTYIDIDTEEEIADEELIDGYENDEYTTEQKDIEYYTFVKSTDNTEGTMTIDRIEVVYYYRKLTFNFDINKTISSVTKNGVVSTYDKSLVKAEVGRNDVDSTSIIVTYKITVTNSGELAGTGTVVDYLPDYFTVSSSNPSYWTVNDDGNLETTVSLKAGESTELTVILNWTQGEDNFGTTTNTAKIIDLENDANYEETSSDDNSSSAKLLMSVRTGWEVANEIVQYVAIAMFGIVWIIMGVKMNKIAKR